MLKLQHCGHLIRRTNLSEKTLMLGKSEGKQKEVAEDEMVRQHPRLHGHESEQTLEDSEGQGGLACCGQQGLQESDTTELLKSSNNRRPKGEKQRETAA